MNAKNRGVIEPLERRLLLAAALVKDINIGVPSSSPDGFVEFNGQAYFAAADELNGRELWTSDGTAGGTRRITDINIGAGDANPFVISASRNRIFFSAEDGSDRELWITDGDSELVGIDINPGNGNSTPQSFLFLPGQDLMIFSADNGTSGQELWVSDGTLAGTGQIADINPGAGDSNPTLPVLLNNTTALFWADNGTNGIELWRTDGTVGGTRLVRDINPGPGNGGATTMAKVGNQVFLAANDGVRNFELWRTDGTTVTFIRDINTQTDPMGNPLASFPSQITDVNGTAFFRANDGLSGAELWSSNGTTATMVMDINPGPGESNGTFFVAFEGKLYFRATDGTRGRELWTSNGTATQIVKDVIPGTGGGLSGLTVSGSKLYFAVDDVTNGTELWESDGTTAGTKIHKDINPGGSSSSPTGLKDIAGALFFSADNGTHGFELWATGVPRGHKLRLELVEGKPFSGTVYEFSANDPARRAGDFTAKINWGDGTTSTGTISGGSGAFSVRGSHTYEKFGGYPVVVTITDTVAKKSSTGAINLSHASGNQSEGTIAIDPSNPNRIYARSNTDTGGDFSALTDDGGETWTSKFVGKGNDGLPAARGDPKAAFDQYGNLFVTHLHGTDAKLVVLLLSTDGGRTFRHLRNISAADNISGLDQPSLATGPGRDGVDGSVWVAFKAINNRIQITGAPVTALNTVGTFTTVQEVLGSLVGNFGDVAVGPTGAVFTNWQTPDDSSGPAEIWGAVDEDGVGPKKISAQILVETSEVGGFYPLPAQPTRTIDAEANVAFDRSAASRFKGRLYMSFTDSTGAGSANTDIYVIYSDDNGFEWSSPVKVSDDTNRSSQILPSIAVDDKTGQIVVFWHDTRSDPANVLTNVMTSMSSDGGITWTPNVQLNIGQSTHNNGAPPPGFRDIDYGDYTSVAIYDGALFPVWADKSAGLGNNPNRPRFDLATNRITVAQVADAPIIPGKRNITAQRYRQTTNALVATFTDENPFGNLSEFSAIINWGDGKTSTGAVSLSGGVYRIKGSHTYTTLSTRRTVAVTINSIGGSTAEARGTATIINPVATPVVAMGADEGQSPTIAVFDPRFGTLLGTFNAYDRTFRGGVRVAVADVNDDGFLDIIAAPGPGTGVFGQVRIFDGVTFTVFQSNNGLFSPYGEDHTAGMFVAAGDINNDNTPDIIVGSGPGPKKRLMIMNGLDGTVLGKFYVHDTRFVGGVRVATGDVNGDGKLEIVTAPGPGLPRAIRVWDPATALLVGAEIRPFGSAYRKGFHIATGDFDGDGKSDIVAARNDADVVSVFRGTDRQLIFSATPFNSPFNGGVRVATWDSNLDGIDELIAAPGAGVVLPVKLSRTGAATIDILPFGSRYSGGLFVAAGAI